MPESARDAYNILYLITSDIITLIYFTGSMKSPSGDQWVKDKRFWHMPAAKCLITMWRYWQKLVFH